jgi:hypothetical protein
MLTKRICAVRCVCVIVNANILRIKEYRRFIMKSAVVVREYKWCTQLTLRILQWLDPAAWNNNYRRPPADFKDKPVR